MILGLLFGYPKTIRFTELLGSLKREKFFITIFEFIAQFYFQNDIFELQEVFSEGLGIFQAFLILQI
jgi:hypothetical protein